jgi:hypothetical protein
MMRKYHRWLAILSGLLMLWIAATGFIGQVMSVAQHGLSDEHKAPPATMRQTDPAPAAGKEMTPMANVAMASPDSMQAPVEHKPNKKRTRDWYHFIIDLHSGNAFGGVGRILSILMGAALVFFSLSGIWMYVDMFRRRLKAQKKGVFWK